MSAVELRGREEIERGGEEADPSGAADRMKKNVGDRRVGIEECGQSMEDEGGAEDGADVVWIGEAGNDFCVQDAEDERGDGYDEADERAGGADVKERAAGANRRANHDESAEGADQRRKWDKEGIAGVDVVVAAGEVVSEFVHEQDGEKCQREREAADECKRMFVEKSERVQEFIEVDRFVFGVSCGEMSARDEASAESDEEENDGEEQGLEWRVCRDGRVPRWIRDEWREGLPVGLR